MKTAPLTREVDVHYRSLTPPSSPHLLWMVPPPPLSPPQPPDVTPVPPALSPPLSPTASQVTCMTRVPFKFTPTPTEKSPVVATVAQRNQHATLVVLLQGSHVIHDAFASFLSCDDSILDAASAHIICPHCPGIFWILNLQKWSWASRPWAPFSFRGKACLFFAVVDFLLASLNVGRATVCGAGPETSPDFSSEFDYSRLFQWCNHGASGITGPHSQAKGTLILRE